MHERTIAIGDIHGDLAHALTLWERLPVLTASDTIVFLGDYVDRGPDSRGA
ncbi:MAG TPA: metallophosphoesterase [Pyrinomonadaceae bacterium]|jgi:serine/threonine protein phosphatase 1